MDLRRAAALLACTLPAAQARTPSLLVFFERLLHRPIPVEHLGRLVLVVAQPGAVPRRLLGRRRGIQIDLDAGLLVRLVRERLRILGHSGPQMSKYSANSIGLGRSR